jgi:hypothetical protein
MKKFKEYMAEMWVEFDKKIAGNIDDPSLHPSQHKDGEKTTIKAIKKLNKIFKKGKQ